MFIEEQIKNDNMNQYVQRKVAEREKTTNSGKHVLNIVLGGARSPPPSSDRDGDVMMIQPCQDEPIVFSNADYEGLDPDHNEALVVTLDVAENEVKRILVDNGSSVNIVFEHTLNRMKLGHIRMDSCFKDPLYGFRHNMVSIKGLIYLPILFGTAPEQISHIIKFYVISSSSSYNMILGRPTLTKLRAITSTTHLNVKFPTPGGIGEIKGDREVAG